MKRTVDIGSPEPDSEEPAAGSVDIAVSALLTPDLQQRFAGLRFNSETATPPAYVLAKNTYVLIDPDLRKAMDVVRQKRKGSESEKRDFIRNPRAAVCQAMGLEGGSPLAAALFIETKQYSERVIGLGIWAKPTLPFLSRICENWLPETFSVSIGGKPVAVTRGEIERLAADVDDAVASGVDTVLFKGKELSRNDAKVIVEDALKLAALEGDGVGEVAENDGTAAKASKEGEQRSEKLVLVATTNFDGVEYEQQRKKREAYISRSIPGERLGAVTLKPHQDVGFNWLLEGWCSGSPGLLLADDMGLGKTLQALVFMAWIRENQLAAGHRRTAQSRMGPIIIVAPTALLQNWADEAGRFLAEDALGERIDAFGVGLRRLTVDAGGKSPASDRLDIERIRDAGWVLTTYETLADNHRSFAKIPFSVAIFDEMQKIKDPSTLNSHAARTVNADFVVGLTGTPIENRMEDLWSIMDRVAPGYLGDLKSFSRDYAQAAEGKLKDLKSRLDQPQAKSPPMMLRACQETTALHNWLAGAIV